MNKKNPESHPFWSGFSLGALCGGVAIFMFSSKKGRKVLKSILENSDSIENNIEHILEMLQKSSSIFGEVKKMPPKTAKKVSK